jgi:maleylpyruvate isomerase
MTTITPASTAYSRHLDWMTGGYGYFWTRFARISDDELSAPSALPGWTRRHLLSHVGHNARAVRNLAQWAATGQTIPMYATPTARGNEIAAGASWEPKRLRSFIETEQSALAAALQQLDNEQLATEVVTAQGRHVPAAVLPWLRTRELWIHAVDLDQGADFSDFPQPLLDELIVDVLRWRRDVRGERVSVRPTDRALSPAIDEQTLPTSIEGGAADLARWLTGRAGVNIQTSNHSALPTLSAWL